MSTTDHTAAAARRSAAEQEHAELRAALQEERRGYVQRGREDRVAGVDAQLRALDGQPQPREVPPVVPATPAPAGNPPVKGKADEGAAPRADPQSVTTDASTAAPAAPEPEKRATPARGAKVTDA